MQHPCPWQEHKELFVSAGHDSATCPLPLLLLLRLPNSPGQIERRFDCNSQSLSRALWKVRHSWFELEKLLPTFYIIYRVVARDSEATFIELSNAGAPLVLLEPSSTSIDDLSLHNFDQSECMKSFNIESFLPSGSEKRPPFVMFVLYLESGGMVLTLALDHRVGDTHSLHLTLSCFTVQLNNTHCPSQQVLFYQLFPQNVCQFESKNSANLITSWKNSFQNVLQELAKNLQDSFQGSSHDSSGILQD